MRLLLLGFPQAFVCSQRDGYSEHELIDKVVRLSLLRHYQRSSYGY